MDQVLFFDTTCRDGKQAPGNNHGPADTVRIAHQAAALGINIFEAGFAVSSELDFQSVSRVAKEVDGIVPCSLARASTKDIEAAARALEGALVSPRIHTFIATSDIHMEHKLQMSRDQVLEKVADSVRFARTFVDDVEWSAEDAMRSDFEFLKLAVREAIFAGARTVNVPDTVGYLMPGMIREKVSQLIAEVPEINEYGVVVSVHCHDDLDCATANTLAGIEGGARQVECTINGIGERAGNTHYAPVVMALSLHKDYFGVTHSINTQAIGDTARLLSSVLQKPVPSNLPVVGENVFAHGSGIHQHGVSGNTQTYEIMTPDSVGWKAEGFPLSSQSGRRGLSERLRLLGYELGENELRVVYDRFESYATGRSLVSNNELHMLMQQHRCGVDHAAHRIVLDDISYAKVGDVVGASVTLCYGGVMHHGNGRGAGPFAAAKQALSEALRACDVSLADISLVHYDLEKGEGGADAIGQAHITVQSETMTGFGYAENVDTVLASVQAYVQAVNHLLLVGIPKDQVDV